MAKPIIPWIGGKSRLAARILPVFPEHTCYVEPFAGAAALFFLKEPSRVEVLNDINGDLVNLYRVIQHHLEEFVRQFKWVLTSRQGFDRAKETPIEILTDIQRAARFYHLQRLAFGGKVEGQTFGTQTTSARGFNLLRIEEDLSAAHLRLNQVLIEHLGWADVVKRYDRPHTLFYLDPPYFGTEGYGVEFGLEEYVLMAELLRTMKGKAIVSVNDIPAMREAFKGLQMTRLTVNYTVGAAGRGRGEKGELLIRNFP